VLGQASRRQQAIMSGTFHDHNEQEEKTKLCHLWLLPHELFLSLSEYLLENGKKKFFQFNDDWRYFVNTSKEYLGELKRQTRYISLANNSTQFLRDPLFRQRILSLVDDPSLQISCDFLRNGGVGKPYDASVLCNLNQIHINFDDEPLSLFTNVEEVHLRTGNREGYLPDFKCLAKVKKKLSITIWNADDEDDEVYGKDMSPNYDLSCLSPTLESLSLTNANRVHNYHLFTNLRVVELCSCDSIKDVSCFRNAKTVKLSWCRYVTNVNSLSNVKELDLISCDGVTDVSALGRVEVMKIGGCKNLHDLSALSTVHTLRVSDFPKNLLSSLKQNTVLNVSYFRSELTSIQFLAGNKLLRELDFSGNENLRDISMLSTVEVLDITGCLSITSLTGLTALKELKMSGVEGIESGFEVFQQLKKLRIGKVVHRNQTIQALEKAPFLSSLTLLYSNLPIDSLIQVEDLVLWDCQELTEFPATLILLRSLKISGCYNLESFPAFLPFLQFLHISGTDKLALLKIFGEPNSPPINEVEISYCSGLKEIQISRIITSLVIQRCWNLKEISGNELVRSLKEEH
jgi:hypothetical protein